MLEWYLALGGTEVANHARLAAYAESVGSPLDSVTAGGCETFDAALVGDAPYTTPDADAAPWYDPDVPESAQFCGVMVLSVEGLDDRPVTRTVTSAVTGGAALGPARVQPRTITVTAVLLGATCCAVEYGLRWLGQALAGGAGDGCGGDDLTFYNCCPPTVEDTEEAAARHRRTVRRVALASGPTVTARSSSGCTAGTCSLGADLLTVEFVLTAGTPWAWMDAVPVLDVAVPSDDGSECVTWCVHASADAPVPVCVDLVDEGACSPGGVLVEFTDTDPGCAVSWPDYETAAGPCAGSCRLATCPNVTSLCSDPTCRTPSPPVPPLPQTCFCHAIAVNAETYELDLATWPSWFGAVPIITVTAGSNDLRRLTISIFERSTDHDGMTCQEVAELERCNPHSVFEVAYVPPSGVLTLDGQVGRPVVECSGRQETSPDAYGRDGAPLMFPLLGRGRYCVLIEADAIHMPADDAAVAVALSGREY